MKPKSKPLFEHKPCTRCGGSGHYSYCSMHGTTCFKCRGVGYTLTKRGHAAQAYLDSLRRRPAGELKVGDLILEDSFFKAPSFQNITAIEVNEHGNLTIVTPGLSQTCEPTTMIRVGLTAEQKATYRAAALAYQDTLTASGLPKAQRKSKTEA